MAFDTILQEKMKVRHKQGFRPPKRGRKTDLEGDALVSRSSGNALVSVVSKGCPPQHRRHFGLPGSARRDVAV